MGMIRQLSPAVVNQIAAGEVVERPASVVKELLENAIDAGATRIDLTVERGGKDLVRVADNGMGMSPDDLLLAFQPHATSKLAEADDLYRIRTLGFRGEALAAIAEVSKVRCQTRQAGADEGSELCDRGGTFGPVKSCGGPVGTVIEVRNLFFNTPVRRTFLKSDMTEAGHVVEMFSRIALAHPEIHLTYRSGGKIVHDLPPVAGHARADRGLLRPRAGRVAALGRGPDGRDAPLGLRRPPVAEPVDGQGAVPLPGGPVRPRPVAEPRAERGLSRPADGRAGCPWRSSTWTSRPRRSTSTSIRPRSRSGSATRTGSTATCWRRCARRS